MLCNGFAPAEKGEQNGKNRQGGYELCKGIKALGKPSHVSIKISDSHDSLSVFPCDEDDVMAFRVPLKLFTDHRCVMRINSKQFVHGIMRTNQMDTSKTYVLSGEFLEEKNTAVFSLVEGVSLRTQKGMAQS